jgi:hypothetical protein
VAVELLGNFCVWFASKKATFLSGKFVFVNWDVDELNQRREEIEKNPTLLTLTLEGPVLWEQGMESSPWRGISVAESNFS